MSVCYRCEKTGHFARCGLNIWSNGKSSPFPELTRLIILRWSSPFQTGSAQRLATLDQCATGSLSLSGSEYENALCWQTKFTEYHQNFLQREKREWKRSVIHTSFHSDMSVYIYVHSSGATRQATLLENVLRARLMRERCSELMMNDDDDDDAGGDYDDYDDLVGDERGDRRTYYHKGTLQYKLRTNHQGFWLLCTQRLWMHIQILLYLLFWLIWPLFCHHGPLSRRMGKHINRQVRRGIRNLAVTQCETSMEGLVIMDYS